METITVLALGRLKEPFYLQAAAEYAKRLSGYCKFSLTELPEYRLPEAPSPAQIADGLRREAQTIREKLPKGAWFCVLTPEGKKLSSESFAKTIDAVSVDPHVVGLAFFPLAACSFLPSHVISAGPFQFFVISCKGGHVNGGITVRALQLLYRTVKP